MFSVSAFFCVTNIHLVWVCRICPLLWAKLITSKLKYNLRLNYITPNPAFHLYISFYTICTDSPTIDKPKRHYQLSTILQSSVNRITSDVIKESIRLWVMTEVVDEYHIWPIKALATTFSIVYFSIVSVCYGNEMHPECKKKMEKNKWSMWS